MYYLPFPRVSNQYYQVSVIRCSYMNALKKHDGEAVFTVFEGVKKDMLYCRTYATLKVLSSEN
jgi:hypothetical protein